MLDYHKHAAKDHFEHISKLWKKCHVSTGSPRYLLRLGPVLIERLFSVDLYRLTIKMTLIENNSIYATYFFM
jgi:hypothetical protein